MTTYDQKILNGGFGWPKNPIHKKECIGYA